MSMNASSKTARRGFTLLELTLAVALVATVALLAAQRFSGVRERARATAAAHDLRLLREAFAGSDGTPGYLEDMARVPGFSPGYLRVANLLSPTNLFVYGATGALGAAFAAWDEAAGRGWRGPYARIDRPGADGAAARFPNPTDRRSTRSGTFLACGFFPDVARLSLPADVRERAAAYGFPGEPALLDPWGSPYVLQIPPPQAFAKAGGVLADVPDEERFRYARVVSAGPDGILSTPCYHANTNASGSVWSAEARRASVFGGRPADRGDDLVLFLFRADLYEPEFGDD